MARLQSAKLSYGGSIPPAASLHSASRGLARGGIEQSLEYRSQARWGPPAASLHSASRRLARGGIEQSLKYRARVHFLITLLER